MNAKLLTLGTEPFEPAIKSAEEIGDRGELAWISIDLLRIDPRYQRPILERGRRNIRHIVENFRWSQFSPLVVARRGETFAVIDGQHRAIAAKLHGEIPKVPAFIIAGDAEAEALAFATINGQVTAVQPTQIYYARLAAGEAKAIAIKAACDAAGVNILRAPKAKPKAGETSAITTLETCLKKFGTETVTTALQAITQTGDGNAGFLTAPVIEGTCEVLHMNARWREAGHELFKAVEHVSISRIYNVAMKERAAHKGQSVRVLFVQAMKTALARELGSSTSPKTAAGSAAKALDPKILSTNARDVMLVLSDFADPISSAEVAELAEAGRDRVPGLLTSLAQLDCARATAGKWELTPIGRATADILKAAGK